MSSFVGITRPRFPLMKTLAPIVAFLIFACGLAHAAQPSPEAAIAAVTAADKERVAATIAGDRARLEAIFSADLRYAHSNGAVDTHASFVEALASKRTVYERMEYKERQFFVAAPGVVLMSGRVLATVKQGEQKRALDLNFLSVWREEQGKWRFLSWQSSRAPEPAAK